MTGRLIAVVGPSGAGKDTLIGALRKARPDLAYARRVITRDPAVNDEDADCVSVDAFETREASGDFALSWRAHDLCYAIPKAGLTPLAAGRDVIVSLSRSVLVDLVSKWPEALVLWITARPEVLADRLAKRGREDLQAIAARLRRQGGRKPDGKNVHEIDNSGALEATLAHALAVIYPDNGTVSMA